MPASNAALKVREEEPDLEAMLEDYRGRVAALDRSQAVIEFGLDGTIVDANENFLGALGYRIEEIENPLTRQVRYLDKVVDELAKGRKMEKILRGQSELKPV